MALIDFGMLAKPVSEAAPCGPDLDFEGDLEFMNYLARAEGLLPATFFTRDDEGRQVPFDRTAIALDEEAQAIAGLLETTRDLRLLTLLAKFAILNRDIDGFAQTLNVVARLLVEHWNDVHPRGEDGEFTLRMVTLQTLDDSPTVILPLQHTPLVPSRRYGAITYRNIMVRQGEATAREEEESPDDGAIEAAFREVDFAALVKTRDHLHAVKEALVLVRSTWLEKAGYADAISFPKLEPLTDKILSTLDAAIRRRDPGATIAGSMDASAPSSDGSAPAQCTGSVPPTERIANVVQAGAALAAAAAYFAGREPSSPALLLVRQAQHLMGKSFHEVIETLLPSHAEQAAISFGTDQVFELPIQRLSGFLPGDGADDYESTAYNDEAAQASEASSEDAQSMPEGDDPQATPAVNENGSDSAPTPPPINARTRHEALALLEQVSAFYRSNEPASPIPLLIDRACVLSQKDFLTLLKDVLPSLRAPMSD
jgi:type VI secretion system protein ImpA